MTEISATEYFNRVGVEKHTNIKQIDCCKATIPPRYKFIQRRKALEHLAYLLGIMEGMDKTGNIMVELVQEEEKRRL